MSIEFQSQVLAVAYGASPDRDSPTALLARIELDERRIHDLEGAVVQLSKRLAALSSALDASKQ